MLYREDSCVFSCLVFSSKSPLKPSQSYRSMWVYIDTYIVYYIYTFNSSIYIYTLSIAWQTIHWQLLEGPIRLDILQFSGHDSKVVWHVLVARCCRQSEPKRAVGAGYNKWRLWTGRVYRYLSNMVIPQFTDDCNHQDHSYRTSWRLLIFVFIYLRCLLCLIIARIPILKHVTTHAT